MTLVISLVEFSVVTDQTAARSDPQIAIVILADGKNHVVAQAVTFRQPRASSVFPTGQAIGGADPQGTVPAFKERFDLRFLFQGMRSKSPVRERVQAPFLG